MQKKKRNPFSAKCTKMAIQLHEPSVKIKSAKRAYKPGEEVSTMGTTNYCSGEKKKKKNYAHFSYKEIEQEITGRSTLCAAWKMLQENANQLIASIERRANKLEVTTSFPLSEQNSFDLSVENKASNFNNLADKFLFGGEIYVRSCATKSTTKGLLEWKANRLHDVSLHEELVGYFNDVNDFKAFLASKLPGIKEYLNLKATIKRNYNLELQAKGVAGVITRANAKRKRDNEMAALTGKEKTTFVPLVRKFVNTRGEQDKVRKVN